MNDMLILVLMVMGGAILGVLYFSGLWLTVQRIHHGKYPALWLVASLVLRMALLLTAFYLILSYGRWEHLLAALAGFVILRIFSTRSMRRQVSASDAAKEEQI